MKKIIIVVIIILIIGGTYFIKNKSGQDIVLSFTSCTTSLFETDKSQYEFWKSTFATLHPEFKTIYDAGSYCKLNDGTQLISFSHFKTTDPKSGSQTIALFDANNKLLKETKDFDCNALGDLGTPYFQSISDEGVVLMNCTSADGGLTLEETYSLDINTFIFKLVD